MEPLAADDPSEVGDYRLEGRLGAGGMGRVYLGRSRGGRPVAVKVVRPELAGDKGFRRRFAREVEAARKVNAFYTAPVIDADTEADPPWLVTAYVPGPSLRTAVEEQGPLPAEQIAALGAGLAEGLLAIHREGIVHRDLTPGNVILAGDGPRIVDFGIARALDATSPATTTGIIGTVAFMSPEQAKGAETGAAGDVFALACVLTYAATGRSPFGTGAPEAVLFRVVHGEPDLTGVPEDLRDLLAACLAKDPASRPEATELLDGFTRSAGPHAESRAHARTAGPGGRTPVADRAADGPGTGTPNAAGAAGGPGGGSPGATAVFHSATTERVPPPSATRVEPPASFTLTRRPSGARPGIRHLAGGGVLGLILGLLGLVITNTLDELPFDNDDMSGNLALFLIAMPAAAAFLGLFVDPVEPYAARVRAAGLSHGCAIGGALWVIVGLLDSLDDLLPEDLHTRILSPWGLVAAAAGAGVGLLVANRTVQARHIPDHGTRVTSWYAPRQTGALTGLLLATLFLVSIDGEGPLEGDEPGYTITVVLVLTGLTAVGALLGLLAEPAAARRRRPGTLTVDSSGLFVARPDHGPSVSVTWDDVERVELLEGRVIAWFPDAPATATWANRRGLAVHAVERARAGVPPRTAYVIFDSGLDPDRHGEAGSLHHLDEALHAFGGDRYR